MLTMKLSLPFALKAHVDGLVAEGQYASVGEYVRELILTDAKAKAQARLEDLLLEGLEGEATEWTDSDSNRLLQLARAGQ